MIGLISTSLKVVSIAAVFCASLRRRAIVWRRRDMRTRSSRTFGLRAAAGGAFGARASIAAMASALVIRPSRPVPVTPERSAPASPATRWALGGTGWAPPEGAAAWGAGAAGFG